MTGDESLGYRYLEIGHSFSHHRNDDGISYEEVIEALVMEDVDICLLRPDTIILTFMDFIIAMKMVQLDIGLKRTATILLSIVEFIMVVIKVVTMVEVDIGLKRPATIPIATFEQELILMEEVSIGLIPATITLITQAAVVDCLVSKFLLVLLIKTFTKIRE